MVSEESIQRKIKGIDKKLKSKYIDEIFEVFIPNYVEMVMTEYDVELVGAVTDRKSRTNPALYRDEFEEALNNFDYVEESNNKTVIHLPEVNTFPWSSGRLRIIQNILEGIIGNYIEVDEEQYIALYTKKPIFEPYDKTVPPKQRIYLLKWNLSTVKRRWQEVFPKENPVRYPFSNSPALDIFFNPNTEVVDNIENWFPKFIEKSAKEISKHV